MRFMRATTSSYFGNRRQSSSYEFHSMSFIPTVVSTKRFIRWVHLNNVLTTSWFFTNLVPYEHLAGRFSARIFLMYWPSTTGYRDKLTNYESQLMQNLFVFSLNFSVFNEVKQLLYSRFFMVN